MIEVAAELREEVTCVLESVPPERRGTRCIIGQNEPATLEWWMGDHVRHLRHHLAQILDE